MSLPDGFLNPETRCGYEIPTKIKRIWAVELDLLAQFQRICSKYDIKYVALWGTALGAARHHGFIPWDDDIDVGMDRHNYDKFCRVASKELGYPYFFQTPLTDRQFFSPLARLRNSETTAVIKGFNSTGYNNGIYIDIEVLDDIAPTKFQWRIQNALKHMALIPIKLRMPCYSVWVHLYARMLGLYSGKSRHKGIAHTFAEAEWKSWVDSDGLENANLCDFEFMKVPLMRDWESYLVRAYGEWQKFPPESVRGQWHKGQVYFDPDKPFRNVISQDEENSRA